MQARVSNRQEGVDKPRVWQLATLLHDRTLDMGLLSGTLGNVVLDCHTHFHVNGALTNKIYMCYNPTLRL